MKVLMKQAFFILMILVFIRPLSADKKHNIDSLKALLDTTENKAKVLNELAAAYLYVSPKESYQYSQDAATEAVRLNDRAGLSEALWLTARYYLVMNNYELSNTFVDSASRFFHEIGNYESEINCQVMKASSLMLQGEYNEALKVFEYCEKESERIGVKHIHSSILMNIGRIYRVRGGYATAVAYFQKSLDIAREIGHTYLEGNAYYFIGLIHQDQQQFGLAIDQYLKALGIMEENNFNATLPYLLVSLGTAYKDNKNYKESIKYFRDAKKYYEEINDRWGLAELFNHMGSAYFSMDKPDSSWTYYDKALGIYREINEKAGVSNTLNFMGEILMQQQEYDRALEYLDEAQQINDSIENTLTLVSILLNKGRCYVYMGLAVKGLDLLQRGMEIADSAKLFTEKILLHKALSRANTRLKRYSQALDHYEAYSMLNDSLHEKEATRHFIEMEQKYQAEKREKEISQLKLNKIEQDITIRRERSVRNILVIGFLSVTVIGILLYRSYRVKKKADKEKESLLKEIHHRVKNNLQIISSLLSIQSENVTDTSVINAVKESQSRVKAMALIHQLLYQDKDLTRISFEAYLPQLINALASIFKMNETEVDIDIQAGDISLDIDVAIPLGLIVTELVSNAFKYAFKDSHKGMIRVNLESQADRHFKLTVADNGEGLPENLSIDQLSSMGLRLVKILTDQLDGELHYSYNHGAVFTIIFANNNKLKKA